MAGVCLLAHVFYLVIIVITQSGAETKLFLSGPFFLITTIAKQKCGQEVNRVSFHSFI